MVSETVRVDLRQATLSESARLREAGELLFLAIENPPPVRSLLRLSEGDEVKAFEVARVIEVVDESEPARGCYGREVDLERLAEQTKVGSEHLEAGISGGGGVPAPVVIMNTGEMMLGEAGEDSEALAAAAAMGDESGEASEAEAGDSEASDSEASDSEASDSEASDSESGDSEASDSSEAEPE